MSDSQCVLLSGDDVQRQSSATAELQPRAKVKPLASLRVYATYYCGARVEIESSLCAVPRSRIRFRTLIRRAAVTHQIREPSHVVERLEQELHGD